VGEFPTSGYGRDRDGEGDQRASREKYLEVENVEEEGGRGRGGRGKREEGEGREKGGRIEESWTELCRRCFIRIS
jgi:hypothetical protein